MRVDAGLWDKIEVRQFSGIINKIISTKVSSAQELSAHNMDKGVTSMLWTIAVILVVLWLLGMITSYTMGGLIHILLVLAIIAVVVNLIRGNSHD
jgi:ABC-type multidrug transport system permease subunit